MTEDLTKRSQNAETFGASAKPLDHLSLRGERDAPALLLRDSEISHAELRC